MRTHKLWILVLVAAALMVGGAGCKKEAAEVDDNVNYLAEEDPNKLGQDGKLPDQNSCLDKGAVGAMGLALGTDCKALDKVPKCGDGTPDAGEECDHGADNNKPGDTCDVLCRKVVKNEDKGGGGGGGGEGGNGGNGGVTVKIKNSLSDKGKLGEVYSATLTAEGADSKAYTWTVTPPEGFDATYDKKKSYKLTIKSAAPITKADTYKFNVKVCEEGSTVNCVTCPETQCSFTIKDKYQIEAWPKTVDYGGHQQDKKICSTDTDNNPACITYELSATDYAAKLGFIPTATGTKDANDPYYVLKLKVGGGINLDKTTPVEKGKDAAASQDPPYYLWSMTVDRDGKAETIPFLRWVDYFLGWEGSPVLGKDGKEVSKTYKAKVNFPPANKDSLFLMDATDDNGNVGKVYSSVAYLMAAPSAMGKEFKNVVVTVTSAQGGTQTIKFTSIKTPEVGAANKAIAEFKTKKDSDECKVAKEFKIDSVKMADGTEATLKDKTYVFGGNSIQLNKDYAITVAVSGGKGKYTVSPVSLKGLTGAGTYSLGHYWTTGDDTSKYQTKEDVGKTIQANSFIIKGGTFYDYGVVIGDNNGDVTDSFAVTVTDGCKQTKDVNIKIKYSIPKPKKVQDIKYVYMGGGCSWCASYSTTVDAQLRDDGGNVYSSTGSWPFNSSMNKFIELKAAAGCKDDSCDISNLKSINLHIDDPCDTVDAIFTLGAACHDVQYNYSRFILVGDYWYAESTKVWNGESDGSVADETAYSGNEEDPLNAFTIPGSGSGLDSHWIKRQHPFSTSEL